jgi:hypothetical protein
MADQPSVERRLLQMLVLIAIVAVVGVAAIVTPRLYFRDVRHAEVAAHRISSLVHVALSRALADGTDVTDLINRFQGIADLEIGLRRLEPGEVHPAASSGRGLSERRDTDLDYTAPPILDREGRTWLATMHFDLSAMKRESIRLIVDLVLAVVIGSAVFSLAVWLLLRRSILEPLREVTRSVEKFAAGEEPALPRFESREISTLAAALERARLRPSG